MFIFSSNHFNYFALVVSFLCFVSFCTPSSVLFISTECPELKEPTNGKLSCRKVSGKLLCMMSCDEGYSFNSDVMTMYGCGPDTNWKWNNMEELGQPKCLSEFIVLC